ncbi:MAG: 2-hydroxyacid dehydrogenase [Thermoplasmataceae archaeon]|jgi:phosphoglycerate dehydrogenase-like enzyme
MDLAFTFNVSPDVLKKCQEITGLNPVVDRESGTDIQIVATKYKITEKTRLIQGIYASLDGLGLKNIPPNVTVCNNPGAFAFSTAEHVFALILAVTKKLIDLNNKTHHKIFKKEPVKTVRGKKIGIIGYGEVGKQIAVIAKSFGMSVIAYTRSQVDDPNVDSFAVSIARLITLSDIIVISLPLTNKTRGIMNKDALAMFNGEIIVNIARAEIVNKEDMLLYLKRFPERYYLADVWWGETRITDEIPPNCILTPHVGDEVPGDIDESIILACRNVKKFLEGAPANVIDPSEYY